jgi:predicted transcriptional regulator
MTNFKNTKFTDLEKQVLRNYLPHQSAFDFGQAPMKIQEIGNDIWENEKVNLTNDTIKGVVGSLVKKGLLSCESHEGNNVWIWLNDIFRDDEDLLNETIELVN